ALFGGALFVDDAGEQGSAGVEGGGGVGTQQQLLGRPEQGGRHLHAAELGGQAQLRPSRLLGGGEAALEALGEPHLTVDQLGRVAVGVYEGLRPLALDEAVELVEDVFQGVDVEVRPGV